MDAGPTGDAELDGLARVYRPCLWAPDKAVLQAAAVEKYSKMHKSDGLGDIARLAMGMCGTDALRVRHITG